MAISAIRENYNDRRRRDEQNGVIVRTRTFQALVTELTDTAETVIIAGVDPNTGAFIPAVGDIHPDDATCRCVSREVQQNSSFPYHFDAVAEYANVPQEVVVRGQSVVVRVPVSRSTLIKAGGVEVANVGITNSAGVPFDPPPERDETRYLIIVSRNELLPPDAAARTYNDTLNQADYRGYSQGELKFRVDDYESRTWGTFFYYRTTYLLEHKPGGWTEEYPDLGFQERFGTDLTEIRDTRGSQFSQGYPLNGMGQRLPPTLDGTLVYRKYRHYTLADWVTALSLPTTP